MSEPKRKKKKSRHLFSKLLTLVLCAVFAVSAWKLYQIYKEYHNVEEVQQEMLQYKPEKTTSKQSEKEEETTNDSLIELQSKYPDVCGWLTIDETDIDYVYAQAKDNDYYLRTTLDGEYSLGGTPFLDYRCTRNFSSFQTILYGHNLKNGSMFQDLENFSDDTFWDEHRTGTVYLPYATYQLKLFAYVLTDSTDSVIYHPEIDDKQTKQEFLDYVKQNATQYREIDVTTKDTILTISTCSYNFDGARSVLIAKVVK